MDANPNAVRAATPNKVALFMVFPFVGCEVAPLMSVSNSVNVKRYRMLVPNQTKTGHGAWSAWTPATNHDNLLARQCARGTQRAFVCLAARRPSGRQGQLVRAVPRFQSASRDPRGGQRQARAAAAVPLGVCKRADLDLRPRGRLPTVWLLQWRRRGHRDRLHRSTTSWRRWPGRSARSPA